MKKVKTLDHKLSAFNILSSNNDKLHTAIQERVKAENPHGQNLFKDKSPAEILQHIHSHDPTGSSYKPWLTKTYLNKGIRYAEDLPRAKEALFYFTNINLSSPPQTLTPTKTFQS